MSLLERFKNKDQAVISELLKQKIVNGNMEFAKEIQQIGQVVGFKPGDNIITQGEMDQDVFFIIAGNTSLIINGTELFSRGSGITIGEMSAINPAESRSATLIAKAETVTVKVNVDSFTELLDKYPMAYKFLLIDYNSRMQEKNALIKPCNAKPRLFIASTVEAIRVVEDIKLNLDHSDIEVTLWSEPEAFQAGSYTLESLEQHVKTHDFGLAIMTADDIVISREIEASAPRDNVIFELGLFMGHLGKERTLFAFPKGQRSKLASDLQGVTPLHYKDEDGKIDTTNLVTLLKRKIAEKGVK